ncbi:MAG: hypothetical protein ACYDHA_12845 [Bellilinea sp.]
MGGYGSSRWRSHQRKYTVEECLALGVKVFTAAPSGGHVHWKKAGAKIKYSIVYNDLGYISSIRLEYIFDKQNVYDYVIKVIHTQTSWGALRNWFLCPECGSKTGKIYKPPGIGEFACRQCHNLGYESQLGNDVSYMKNLIDPSTLAKYPGLTFNELAILYDSSLFGRELPDGIRVKLARIASDKANYYIQRSLAECNPYSKYLTEEDLCTSSGLSGQELISLKTSRLLVPDHQGKYRPKLLSWAKKLKQLLDLGWTVDEIKDWSKTRWGSGNPREWLPKKNDE